MHAVLFHVYDKEIAMLGKMRFRSFNYLVADNEITKKNVF